MRSPTTDAAILLYARVDFVRSRTPSAADCWLLDAFHHLTSTTPIHGRRASEAFPDPMPQRKERAA